MGLLAELKYGWWLPPNMGAEVAGEVDSLIYLMHGLMIVLFVGWGAFMVWVIAKFRARPGHKATYELPKAKASKGIEVAVVVAEVVLLVGFSMPVWAKVKDQIPSGPDVVRVRLVAEQFAWNFQYPGKDGKFGRRDAKLMSTENPLGLDKTDPDGKDDVVSLNLLHIPVNKDIVVEGTSKDVIHSFFIPVLRTKHDMVPGMLSPVWFKATKTTDDITNPTKLPQIACAQLCGNLHYRMRGYVSIDSQEKYDKWLAENAGTGDEEEEEE